MAKQKKKIDWEAVEKLYRAGKVSIREIARRNGCSDKGISKKAKAEGWKRDLSEKIRQKVRTELVRTPVRTPGEEIATEKEIIDAGAQEGVQIELLQRKDIQRLSALVKKFTTELDDDPTKVYITQFQGEIIQETLNLTITEKSTALNNLANALHRKIDLERRAYNMDDGEDPQEKRVFVFGKHKLPESVRDLIPLT